MVASFREAEHSPGRRGDVRVQHRESTGGSEGKESICNVGDLGSIPGLGRSLEEGMATHSSILAWRIPMDRRAWRATLHGVAKSWMHTKGHCHPRASSAKTRGFHTQLDEGPETP